MGEGVVGGGPRRLGAVATKGVVFPKVEGVRDDLAKVVAEWQRSEVVVRVVVRVVAVAVALLAVALLIVVVAVVDEIVVVEVVVVVVVVVAGVFDSAILGGNGSSDSWSAAC